MRKLVYLLLISGLCAYGGQSIRFASGTVGAAVPAQSTGASFYVEFSIHDWGTAVSGHPQDLPALGVDVQWVNTPDLRLQIYGTRESGGATFQFATNLLPSQFMTVRWQHDATNKVDHMQVWDINGTKVYEASNTYTSVSGSNSSGVYVQPTGVSMSTAYFRAYVGSVLPLNSTPPITSASATGALFYWKFDGNLTDQSSNGYTAGVGGGASISYVATPGQSLVISSFNTGNAPSWGTWISMLAGVAGANSLVSTSYSQADAPTITCAWSLLSGPSTITFSSAASCTTTITNSLVFGDYDIQLVVSDGTNSATTHTHIGAVPYDSNGVVIQSNPDVTTIYGPMIAFGQNPWGWMDERNIAMVRGQQSYYDSGAWLASQPFMTHGAGTVDYTFSGKGVSPATGCATLAAAITSTTQLTITVSNAACFDMTSLPAHIMIGNGQSGTSMEIVRICSVVGNVFTVCYDGRGIDGWSSGVAQTWSIGTAVGQYKIKGTGTSFVTDATVPLCPGGAPGPAGAVIYNTGTVTLTASSTTVTGSGTTFTSAMIGDYIRVTATHASGTSFVWWSLITAFTDATHLTVQRAAPSDIDATAFTYKIITPRWAVLHFNDASGNDVMDWQGLSGCESETAAYGQAAHDNSFDNTFMPSKQYSYIDTFGAQSQYGPNFYGSGFALRAFYYRSGLQQALDLANRMDDWWARSPELASGYNGGLPLLQGGGIIGAFANLILNPSTLLHWYDVEQYVLTGEIGAASCDGYDSRDSGYYEAWVTLAAMYEPDATKKAAYRTALQAIYTRENSCRSLARAGLGAIETNSWANGAIFNSTGPALTLTNGSANVTGTGFTAGMCHGVASGSITVTNGSAAISGTGLVTSNKITITGTSSGVPFVAVFQFTQSGGTTGSLSGKWAGDTGTATYVIEDSDNNAVIGTGVTDPGLQKVWACTYVSPTQLTLNRTWDGTTGSSYHMYSYGIAGYGQQPYMLGIKTTMFKWASNLDATLSTNFAGLAAAAATWVHDYGYDTSNKGMFYGRIFGECEPPADIAGSFVFRNIGCNFGIQDLAYIQGRSLNAETSAAYRSYYDATATTTWQDQAYGATWCATGYQSASLNCDTDGAGDHIGASNQSDAYLSGYKYPGFFFGMGMAHQWPAIRVSAAGSSSTILRGVKLRGVIVR